MAVKLYNDTDIQNIADSIRAKNGSGSTYKVSEISAAINGLEVLNGETVSITPSTSAQTITPSSGHNGITEVNVAAVTSSIDSNIQAGNIKKDVSILGVTGTLNEGITPTGELAITSNGTYNVTDYATANVNVPEKQLGTKTITENGIYKATDDNLDGYSEVKVATTGVDIYNYYFSKSPDKIYGTSLLRYIKSVPPLDLTNMTVATSFFDGCGLLENIEGLNTSQIKDTRFMFQYCSKIKEIPQIDTSNVTNMYYMFAQCSLLETIPRLNANNLISISDIFYKCYNLKKLGGFENLGMAYEISQSANYSNYTLNLSSSDKLTHESLINIINNLYDIKTKGCNAQKLILGTTNINKLTSEEIAIATEKGWTVS